MLAIWAAIAGSRAAAITCRVVGGAAIPTSITYGELDERSELLRSNLQENGVKPHDRVALALGASIAELVGLVAVLKCGAIYVPIDPNLPPADRDAIVQDAGVRVLLVPASSPVASTAAASDRDGCSTLVISLDVASGRVGDCVYVSTGSPPTTAPRMDLLGALYIIYTSGSTGAAKGVVGTEAGTLNRLEWMWRDYPWEEKEEQEVVLRRTPLTFVDSVWELWGTILSGMMLLLPRADLAFDPISFWSTGLAPCYRVSRLTVTPSLLASLLRAGHCTFPPTLRYCLCSGEPLSVSLAKSFFSAAVVASLSTGLPHLLNLYGSTEVSGDITCFDLTQDGLASLLAQQGDEALVPLGSPLPNCDVEIVNGELVVKGVCVAKGYYNVSNDQGGFVGEGRFVTGDLVERKGEKGLLMFRGRRDGVVKVRGVRVGVEEAEVRVRRLLDSQGSVAVVAVEGLQEKEERQLCLVLTQEALDAKEGVAEIMLTLRSGLQSVMVPSVVMVLDEGEQIPTTTSGKTDRRVLVEMYATRRGQKRTIEAEGRVEGEGIGEEEEVEGWLEAVYTAVLGRGEEDNGEAYLLQRGQAFMLRGGDSLAAAQVLWSVREEYGVELSMLDLEKAVKEVAREITRKKAPGMGREVKRQAKEAEEREEVVAVSSSSPTQTLRECWRVSLGKCIDATPLVIEREGEGAMVVIGSHDHVMVGVEVETGRELWMLRVGGRVEGTAARATWDDLVFVGCHDHRLYALNYKTGEIAWTFGTGGEIKCRPLALALPSASDESAADRSTAGAPLLHHIVIFGSYDGSLYILDQASGTLLLTLDIGGSLFASPISLGTRASSSTTTCTTTDASIFLCTNKGVLSRWLLRPPSTTTIIAASSSSTDAWALDHTWTHELGSPTFSTPCFSSSATLLLLGCTDGSVRAVSTLDGAPLWRCATGGPVFSSPVCYGDVVCSGCHDGRVRAIRVEDGTLLWSLVLPQGPKGSSSQAVFATPFIVTSSSEVGGDVLERQVRVVIGSCSGRLCILDGQTGHVLASWQVDGELFSSPVVVQKRGGGERVVIGCRDDHLYCLLNETR